MNPGASVIRAASPRTVAHHLARIVGDVAITSCGRRYRVAELDYNDRRREPCERCGAVLEATA